MGHLLLPARLGELLLECCCMCSSCGSGVSHLHMMQCSVNFLRSAFLLKPDRFLISSSMEPFIKALPSPSSVISKWPKEDWAFPQRSTVCVSFFFLFFFFAFSNHLLIISENAAIPHGLLGCHQSSSSDALSRCRQVPRCWPCHVPAHCWGQWCPSGAQPLLHM